MTPMTRLCLWMHAPMYGASPLIQFPCLPLGSDPHPLQNRPLAVRAEATVGSGTNRPQRTSSSLCSILDIRSGLEAINSVAASSGGMPCCVAYSLIGSVLLNWINSPKGVPRKGKEFLVCWTSFSVS